MRTPTEQELQEAARRLRQKNELECDDFTVARLRAARLRALEARRRPFLMSWQALGGIATAGIAAALAGVLWLKAPSDLPSPRGSETPVADIELLTTKESPDFYTELDFYDWLASEADAS